MKPEWTEYLNSIGVDEVLQGQVKKIYEDFQPLIKQEFLDIFVSDRVDGEGIRQFENLVFVTEDFLLESRNFINANNIDIVSHSADIVYIKIEKEEFDIPDYNAKSRLVVYLSFSESLRAELRASGNNCPVLLNFIKNNLIPEFIKYAKSS